MFFSSNEKIKYSLYTLFYKPLKLAVSTVFLLYTDFALRSSTQHYSTIKIKLLYIKLLTYIECIQFSHYAFNILYRGLEHYVVVQLFLLFDFCVGALLYLGI